MTEVCPLCEEEIPGDATIGHEARRLFTPEGPRYAHRVCMLRDAMGGIGHLIDHEYWCSQHGDPDGGLTRYQSAQLVDAYYHIIGVKEVVSDDDEGVGAPGASDRQADGGTATAWLG